MTAGVLSAAPFMAPAAINVEALLPPPPALASPLEIGELEVVLQVQADRTPEQLARADRVAKQTVFTFGGPVLGAWFTAENLPKTAAFFAEVTKESYEVAKGAKAKWNRLRPYLRDERVQPLSSRSRSPSYPSGHASDAATWCVLLDAAFPGRRAALDERVRESMWGRVMAGVHFPSDVAAGRVLGLVIGETMLKSPEMDAALAEIRAEVAPFLAADAAKAP